MHRLLWIFFLFVFVTAGAQINVGQWRDHLPYSRCKKVVKVGPKIYCATDLNLFTFDIRDNSIQKLSRITGLSDMGISTMANHGDILLIAYNDGNIDLIKGNQIINFPDVMHSAVTGSKSANHIFFQGNLAYICYSFGIAVLDVDKLEIKDTYRFGEAGETFDVLSITATDQYFYAATDKGIFRARTDDPFLIEFGRWTRETSIPNSTGRFNLLENVNGIIVANFHGPDDSSDTMYYLQNNVWRKIPGQQNYVTYEIRTSGSGLLVSDAHDVYYLNEQFRKDWNLNDYRFASAEPRSSLADEGGNVWIADASNGLVVKQSSGFKSILPNGPFREYAYNMLFNNGTLYVTGGGTDVSLNNLFTRGMLFKFRDETWSSVINWKVFDYTAIAADPDDPSGIYIGAWGSGIWNYRNDQEAGNFTEKNSTLQTNIPGQPYVRVAGIVFDKDKNLWATNSGVSAPISVLKKDGSWKSFEWGIYMNCPFIGPISIDKNGYFWVVLPYRTGLFVFDVNGTIDNEKDDRYLKFKPQTYTGEVINNVYCITNDLDGNVWVGTDKGPVVYSEPENVFQGATSGKQVLIPRSEKTDTSDILLGTETINCIAVDGANRKWFGTERSGVYLFTPDGKKQIYHFNTENSPIFSNTIRSIAINDKTGEVFFGTDKGIISFRAKATAGNEDFTNVYVFPNPVREDYTGPITITGLISDAIVKITDISGNLVYQTRSLGGQATWDGTTHVGRRVATGVYLVFCSNDDGSKTFVTKMLVIH